MPNAYTPPYKWAFGGSHAKADGVRICRAYVPGCLALARPTVPAVRSAQRATHGGQQHLS